MSRPRSSSQLAQAILRQTFTCIDTQAISSWFFLLLTQTMKMEQIECSEMSAYKIQTPGNHPKERIQYSEHGESLKSRMTGGCYIGKDVKRSGFGLINLLAPEFDI
jgi:hypothetical protein